MLLCELACLIFNVPGLRAIVKLHSFHLDMQELLGLESNTDVRFLFVLVLLGLHFFNTPTQSGIESNNN